MKAPAALPLQDVTVLDLTHVLAGPIVTMTLGDLGARIIKVEKPGLGDTTRLAPPLVNGVSALFAAVNRNKESVALDIAHADGRRLLLQIAAKVDIVVHNFRPGVMKRLGLEYDALRGVNPALIVCEISGFGQDSSESDRAAFDPIIQAVSGVAGLTGTAAGGPVTCGVPVADLVTPLQAQVAILAALRHRDRTGEGQLVDVSMFDTMIQLQAATLAVYSASGTVPARSGDPREGPGPIGIAKTLDGHMAFGAVSNTFWRSLCVALEREEWIDDPRFRSPSGRSRNRVELVGLVKEVMAGKDNAHWSAVFSRLDVPHAEVLDYEQLLASRLFRERDPLLHVSTTAMQGRQIAAARYPNRHSVFTAREFEFLPGLGEHTTAVLEEFAATDHRRLEQLRAEGVIG